MRVELFVYRWVALIDHAETNNIETTKIIIFKLIYSLVRHFDAFRGVRIIQKMKIMLRDHLSIN
jgi:hypothetical protein